jgi:glycosyltransferase involved in cell wall biosynthesis
MKPDQAETVELSIILPAYNEEQGISFCLSEIKEILPSLPPHTEIIVVDNHSTDATASVVKKEMASLKNLSLITEPQRGYGAACLAGLRAACGRILFIADADATYNFKQISAFLAKQKEGYDVVVGNRFTNNIEYGAMPLTHRYIGNPILSFFVRVFFKVRIHDIHCGSRMITKQAFEKIVLYTLGMEFASEMIIKTAKAHLSIAEVPITYRKRLGTSKLQSLTDGWRHLRFILLYSPLFLFLLPGLLLFATGSIVMMLLYFSNLQVLSIELYVHPMFLFAVMVMVGYQLVIFGSFSKIYAITHLGDHDPFLESLFKKITVEIAGIIGIVISGIGAVIYIYILVKWLSSGFGTLNEIKNAVVALTFVVIGIQTLFSGFMLSILGIKENKDIK